MNTHARAHARALSYMHAGVWTTSFRLFSLGFSLRVELILCFRDASDGVKGRAQVEEDEDGEEPRISCQKEVVGNVYMSSFRAVEAMEPKLGLLVQVVERQMRGELRSSGYSRFCKWRKFSGLQSLSWSEHSNNHVDRRHQQFSHRSPLKSQPFQSVEEKKFHSDQHTQQQANANVSAVSFRIDLFWSFVLGRARYPP